MNDIKTLTDKPIKYVINTHWHYDHTDGNQIFAKDVQIIGHENTRKEIIAGVLQRRLDQAFADLPAALDALEKQIAAEQDPARKAALQQRLAVQEAYREQLRKTKPTPPTSPSPIARRSRAALVRSSSSTWVAATPIPM